MVGHFNKWFILNIGPALDNDLFLMQTIVTNPILAHFASLNILGDILTDGVFLGYYRESKTRIKKWKNRSYIS